MKKANAILTCGTGVCSNYAMIFSTAGALQDHCSPFATSHKHVDNSEKAERMPARTIQGLER